MITESEKNEILSRLMELRSSTEQRIADLERLYQMSEDEDEKFNADEARVYLIIAFENIVLGIKELLG